VELDAVPGDEADVDAGQAAVVDAQVDGVGCVGGVLLE